MKKIFALLCALAIGSASRQLNAQSPAAALAGSTEQRTTLVIKPDGSCRTVTETILPRASAEQVVRNWVRYEKRSDAGNADAAETTTEAKPEATPKPFTDEELGEKFREATQSESGSEEGAEHQVQVEVTKDSVRSVTTSSYASVAELLRQGYRMWWQAGVSFENARFEKDTNGLLRVTLTPVANMQRYARSLRAQWKLGGTKVEFKLVFPGKVLTSGFPGKETNATWLAIDGRNDATLDAAMKLYEQPTVITAEPGGLALDQPLELKALQRAARRGADGTDDLPLTDAGPGFIAEPLSVTIITLHLFPEGEKYFKQKRPTAMQRTGVEISARLFAPKGRTLLSAGAVKVVKATDDKGRALETKPGDEADNSTSDYRSFSGRSGQANAIPVELHLALPAPDAQAIEEISAETVAVTAGSWKQLVLTNIQESATNEISLAEVLPGAKLVIRKANAKSRQATVQLQITGPPSIQRLEFQTRVPGSRESNGYTSERNFSRKGGQSTRTVMVQGYNYDAEGTASETAPVTLVVRFPQDMRRDRVRFTLKGLDLL